MFRIKRLLSPSSITALKHTIKKNEISREIPLSHHFLPQRSSTRFLDFYNLGNKEAIKKEQARLADEMTRGYFADMSELKQHGGKIASANKVMIPAMSAVKFPALEVSFSDGRIVPIPTSSTESQKASLICISFRANSQSMVESWSLPFLDAFRSSEDIRLYEVSFIDSWLLCRSLIKKLLLRFMKKSEDNGTSGGLKRQIVYSFGDHYYFRKELHILNLLTGYIFLLDKFGRIRWQGFGSASQEELASLCSCTKLLLQED